jgi:hypothetical protein
MGQQLSSLLSRINESIKNELEKVLDAEHTNELDTSSGLITAAIGRDIPYYYYDIQILPETRKLPILSLRLSFQVACYRHAGMNAYDQNLKIQQTQDGIWSTLKQHTKQQLLQIRAFQRVNDTSSRRGDLLIALTEYQCQAFARRGEY